MVFRWLYRQLVQPRSIDEDGKRREFILNLLLLSSLLLTFVALCITTTNYLILGKAVILGSIVIIGTAFLIFLGLYLLARAGRYKIAAHLFIALYYILATYTIYQWGILIHIGLLLYVLIIIISGILIASRFAVATTLMIAATLFIFVYLSQIGLVRPNQAWAVEAAGMDDALTFSLVFGIMTLLSWIFNEEIERSLRRARQSELALKKERDLLEQRVEERTRELQKAQQDEVLRLYQFAELGKLTSSLIHDLVNPLTTVSLSLERLDTKEKSRIVKRALDGARRMESFIEMARGHINNQRSYTLFAAELIIQQSLEDVQTRARKKGVNLIFAPDSKIQLYGSPIKFHELITNLLCNAVDAHESTKTTSKEQKTVQVEIFKNKNACIITVQDNGKGMSQQVSSRIFDPFFSTKSKSSGLGLGLSIVKDIVEKDFSGTISVISQEGKGTSFLITLPLK